MNAAKNTITLRTERITLTSDPALRDIHLRERDFRHANRRSCSHMQHDSVDSIARPAFPVTAGCHGRGERGLQTDSEPFQACLAFYADSNSYFCSSLRTNTGGFGLQCNSARFLLRFASNTVEIRFSSPIADCTDSTQDQVHPRT